MLMFRVNKPFCRYFQRQDTDQQIQGSITLKYENRVRANSTKRSVAMSGFDALSFPNYLDTVTGSTCDF